TANRLEVIDGVEIDYTSNELQPVLAGILDGNGNYLERVLGHLQPVVSPWLETLRPLVRKNLSRRFHHHYRGFATAQLHEWEKSALPEQPAAVDALETWLVDLRLAER